MALGRTHIVAPLGATDTERKLVNRTNVALRALDRRKPIATPSVFRDDASRPAAEANPGRIIFVQQADGTVRGQYSDGSSWQTFLATAVSFASPTITYGTTAAAGSLTTTIRSDARLKFPTAIMSAANSSTLTLTDDATDQTLTGSLGELNIVPGTGLRVELGQGIRVEFPDSASATFTLAPNTTTAATTVASIQMRPVAGSRTGLAPNVFSPGSSDSFTSQTFRNWDAQFSSFAGQHTSSTIVGYDVSIMTMAPSASSGGSNNMYGFRCGSTFQINNTNATWAEVATAYFKGIRRLISSPTITTQAGVIIEPPTCATSDQIGLYIRQQTAQATATNRIGLKIDAQNSGTNKYAIHAITDQSWFGPLLQDDSVKLRQGTGRDAETYYDGTNMIIDPDAVGTGRVLIGVTGDDDMLLNAIEIDGDLNHDGANLGVFATAPTTQQTITGSRGGNAALASLLTGLAAYGLIVDSTTA